MAWRSSRPRSSDTIADIPGLCQDNFDAIEDILDIEHGTFGGTSPASGVHRYGKCSVVYIEDAASAVQLESDYTLPLGSMAFATDVGELWSYKGAAHSWDAVGASAGEWSRTCWALSANQGLTDGGLVDIAFDTMIFDDRGEYSPTTDRFTARASGWYWVKAQIAMVASGESIYTTCSGAALPNSDQYTTATPSSGSYNWACVDEYPEDVNESDAVYWTFGLDGGDYYGIQSDNLPTDGTGITADSEVSGYEAYKACDDSSSTYWSSDTAVPSGDIEVGATLAWIKVDFGSGVKRIITGMMIEANDPGSGGKVRNWTLWATSDSAVAALSPSLANGWTQVGIGVQTNNSSPQTYRINNATGYRYYALAVYSQWGSANAHAQIEEWQLLSAPWHVPAGSTRMLLWLMCDMTKSVGGYDPINTLSTYRIGYLASGGSVVLTDSATTTSTTVYEDYFGWGKHAAGGSYTAERMVEYWTPTNLNAMSGLGIYFTNGASAATTVRAISSRLWWDPPNQTIELRLSKSGTLVASKTHSYWLRSQSTAGVQTFDISTLVYMIPSDYIEFEVIGNFISGLTDTISGDPTMTYMHVHKLGGAGR